MNPNDKRANILEKLFISHFHRLYNTKSNSIQRLGQYLAPRVVAQYLNE